MPKPLCIIHANCQGDALYGLPFALPERRYPVYGQEMTYAQYAAAYAACRLQTGEDAVTDFVVYLHLLAEKQCGNRAA